MSLYTFDNDKLKMLQVLKDHIADTTNYDNIVNSLDFISSKNKAKEILGIPNTVKANVPVAINLKILQQAHLLYLNLLF